MKNLNGKNISVTGMKNLPVKHTLKRYDERNWICYGHLTHAEPTAHKTQEARFLTLMDTLGGVNRCFGKRLHWFFRLEGGNDTTLLHLHFVVGSHKVTNGHYHPFTPQEACNFLMKNWSYGLAKVEPYVPASGGIDYITKVRTMSDRDDYYEMSQALKKHLLEAEVAA